MRENIKRLVPLVLFLTAVPCFGSMITFDFSQVHWVNGTANESFELYLANPGSNVTVGFQQATGAATVTPTVASNFSAVEAGLQINVDDGARWGLLGIRADLRFTGNGNAQLTVRTVGAGTSGFDPQVILNTFFPGQYGSEPMVGLQRYFDGNTGSGVYLFGTPSPSMIGLASQNNIFQLTSVQNAMLFGSILNLNPPVSSPGGGGGGFSPFDTGDNPEPATLVLMGTGISLLALLGRRAQARARSKAV